MLEILIASILSFSLGYNIDKLLERKDIIIALILTAASTFTIIGFVYLLPIMHGAMVAYALILSMGLFVSSFVSYED